MWIKAIYKIPQTKDMIFIVSDYPRSNDNPKLSRGHKKETLNPEHFDRCKNQRLPRKDLQWKLRIVRENDFLALLESREMKVPLLSSQSFDSPEDMELLAINLLETPASSLDSLSLNTPKHLCKVPDEDIVEVFI